MTVEKMDMLNLVAPLEDIHRICKDIVLLEKVHIVNSLNEINESNFTLCVLEDNINELVDMCIIKPYKEEYRYKDIEDKLNRLINIFDIKTNVNLRSLEKDYSFDNSLKQLNEIYQEVEEEVSKKEILTTELENLKNYVSHIKHIYKTDIDLSYLDKLHFFNYKIGVLSKENMLKLKRNYENISAIVLHIGSDPSGEVYLIISPRELETETNRILRSLSFHELNLPKEFSGTPEHVFNKVSLRINELNKELEIIRGKIEAYKRKYSATISEILTQLILEKKVNWVMNQTSYSTNFFYLAGWVSSRDKEIIEEKFKAYGNEVILMFKEIDKVNKYLIPPTKLRNNIITKPFEALVKMYGIPSYDELDPTLFLSVTYMLLFGAMFGDVGQGLVLLLGGLFLGKKDNLKLYGGILARLGISSTIFGFLYGSIFGFEHVIPALLIHPIENINSMLLGSVIIGVVFLIFSFCYSIVNNLKQGDIEAGVFSRYGINGLIFYISILALVLNKFDKSILKIPDPILYSIIITSLIIMVIREPLTNIIIRKRPLYHEGPSAYYIESGFDIFETLLNTLSNTISFIRVGAFALNHVGLFIAFQTMAKIINNFAGSIIIFLVGNIIVIFLEGLVVFIQGLRLEYYELFSKYYKGEGVEFKPVKLVE